MKSAVDDITLDDLPPRRVYTNPPKQYTPEELRDLGRRAREVSQKLHEATEQLNESICALEDRFLEQLGEGARGRVEIQRGETPIYERKRKRKGKSVLVGKREWVEFLLYKNGEFFVESNKSGPRFTETHILSTSREMRKLVCYKFAELWVACGGRPPPAGV